MLTVALLLVGKLGLLRRGVCGIFGCLVAGCGVALPLLDLLSLWAGERPQHDCPRLQLPPREGAHDFSDECPPAVMPFQRGCE